MLKYCIYRAVLCIGAIPTVYWLSDKPLLTSWEYTSSFQNDFILNQPAVYNGYNGNNAVPMHGYLLM